MKNFFKLFGIIALTTIIGFSMAACDTGGGKTGGNTGSGGSGGGGTGGGGGDQTGIVGSTSGELIITGLNSYNGKYVTADHIKNDLMLVALANVTGTSQANLNITAAPISNGEATLKVWKISGTDISTGSFGNYNGNSTGLELKVYIYNDGQTFTLQSDHPDSFATGSVNFTNGKGTIDVSSWTFN
jgi:hypothetical protein